MKERLIPYNPAIGCRLPPKEKKEMQILPPEKIGAYLSAAEEHGVLPMFYLELTTGLRRGEITALLWTDLDVKARTLTVSKSAGRLKGEVRVTQPKTANSIRTIILPKETVDLLVQEHAKHPDNPVMFPSPVTGKMYGPDCVGRLHKTLLRKAGITENLRFHDLRHPNVKPRTNIFLCFEKFFIERTTLLLQTKVFHLPNDFHSIARIDIHPVNQRISQPSC